MKHSVKLTLAFFSQALAKKVAVSLRYRTSQQIGADHQSLGKTTGFLLILWKEYRIQCTEYYVGQIINIKCKVDIPIFPIRPCISFWGNRVFLPNSLKAKWTHKQTPTKVKITIFYKSLAFHYDYILVWCIHVNRMSLKFFVFKVK